MPPRGWYARVGRHASCRWSVLQRQDVGDHFLGFVVGHLVRWHRHRTPDTRSALDDLVGELRRSAGVTLVLLRDVLVRRTDDLLVVAVTDRKSTRLNSSHVE